MEENMGWRRIRLLELSSIAWNWCENNGHVIQSKKKGSVVNDDTMKAVSDGYSLAECTFSGTERKKRLQKEKWVNRVVNG